METGQAWTVRSATITVVSLLASSVQFACINLTVYISGAQPFPYHVPLSAGQKYDVPLSQVESIGTFLQLHIMWASF
jgi:hypothetical protein